MDDRGRLLDDEAGLLDDRAEPRAAVGGADVVREEPELLKDAPHDRPVRRLDEVRAAKRAIVKYGFEAHEDPDGGPVEPRQLETQKGA